MCFARTAALQGGFEKQKVNASNSTPQNVLGSSKKPIPGGLAGTKNRARTLQNRPRSDPKHEKNDQHDNKRATSAQEAAKSEKKAPESEK